MIIRAIATHNGLINKIGQKPHPVKHDDSRGQGIPVDALLIYCYVVDVRHSDGACTFRTRVTDHLEKMQIYAVKLFFVT